MKPVYPAEITKDEKGFFFVRFLDFGNVNGNIRFDTLLIKCRIGVEHGWAI